jgi:hypothetical protein
MDDIEKIICSVLADTIDKKLARQQEKLDKIEIGVKNLIAENITLKETLQNLHEKLEIAKNALIECLETNEAYSIAKNALDKIDR